VKIKKSEFITACEDAGVNPYAGYSGRFMYGKTCIGIVGDARDMMTFTLDVIKVVDPDFEENQDAWRDMRQDNMGLDMIYYWPQIEVEEDEPADR